MTTGVVITRVVMVDQSIFFSKYRHVVCLIMENSCQKSQIRGRILSVNGLKGLSGHY